MSNAEQEPVSHGDKVETAVNEFIEHLHNDLPPGPPSELGSSPADRFRPKRTEAEFRRMAAIGKAVIDERLASRDKDQ